MAVTVALGDTLSIRGTIDVSSGTLSLKDGQIARTKLVQEDESPLQISLLQLRVHDAPASNLPTTAASDDLGLIAGTFGTDAPVVQTSDAKATTVTQRARFFHPIDNSYIAGETAIIELRAGMDTTISDGTATIDLEVYSVDGDGAVGSDLCATAAQDINSLTKADKEFALTVTSLSPGDLLDCRVTIAITDSATGTAVKGELSRIRFLRDTKG